MIWYADISGEVLTILVEQHVHSEHKKQLGTSYKHLNYEPALSTVDTLG